MDNNSGRLQGCRTDLIALGIVELGLRNAIMRLVEESVTADKAKARLAAKTGGIVFFHGQDRCCR